MIFFGLLSNRVSGDVGRKKDSGHRLNLNLQDQVVLVLSDLQRICSILCQDQEFKGIISLTDTLRNLLIIILKIKLLCCRSFA